MNYQNPVPDTFSTVRDRIYADPALRLSFNIEQKKAEEQANEIDVKRHTDSAVLPLILDDMKKNQEHMDELNRKYTEFQQTLEVPYPIRSVASHGGGDILATAIGALFGGDISKIAGSALQNNQAASDIDYQNKVNQYGADAQRNAQIRADLLRQLAEAESHGNRLQELQIQQTGVIEARAYGEIEKAKDRFQKATNEGEVIQAADDLKRLGVPISDTAIAAARKDATLRSRRQDMVEASNQYAAIERQIAMYGGATGPMTEQLDRMVSEINAKYGTNYPPVVGGPTWAAKNAVDQLAYREKVQKDLTARFEKEYKLKDKEVVARIADWEADRTFQKERLGIERTRANADMLRATNSRHVDATAQRLVQAQGELDAVNAQLAEKAADKALTPFQKREASKPLYQKQAGLKQKIAGLEAILNKMREESMKDEQPPAGQVPAAGETVYKSGGVTITKR